MKKTFLIFICLVGFLYCCTTNPSLTTEDAVQEEEALIEDEIALEDTLRLKEGKIPENWVQVPLLEDGYYIGFPKEPTKKDRKSSHRIDIKLKRSKYRLSCNLTDLSKEPSFQANKKYRTAYYKAIINDLAEGIEGAVSEQETFYSQVIYEGMRSTIVADDVRIYLQSIIIDSILYTISLTLFDNEKPAYLQLRDKFFYSFGNAFYRNNYEQDSSTTEMTKDTL